MVICLAISALADEPAPPMPAPAFFSKIFQNFRLSSAARERLVAFLTGGGLRSRHSPAVASIWPSGLRQLWSTRLSWAGISTLRTRVG